MNNKNLKELITRAAIVATIIFIVGYILDHESGLLYRLGNSVVIGTAVSLFGLLVDHQKKGSNR